MCVGGEGLVLMVFVCWWWRSCVNGVCVCVGGGGIVLMVVLC